MYAAANPVLWSDPSGYGIGELSLDLRVTGTAAVYYQLGRQVAVQFARVTAGLLRNLAGKALLSWLSEQLDILDATDLLPRVLQYDDILSRINDVVTDEVQDEIEDQLPIIVILGPNTNEVISIMTHRPGHHFVIIDKFSTVIEHIDVDDLLITTIVGDYGSYELDEDAKVRIEEIFAIRPNPDAQYAIRDFVVNNLRNGFLYVGLNDSEAGNFGSIIQSTANFALSFDRHIS